MFFFYPFSISCEQHFISLSRVSISKTSTINYSLFKFVNETSIAQRYNKYLRFQYLPNFICETSIYSYLRLDFPVRKRFHSFITEIFNLSDPPCCRMHYTSVLVDLNLQNIFLHGSTVSKIIPIIVYVSSCMHFLYFGFCYNYTHFLIVVF